MVEGAVDEGTTFYFTATLYPRERIEANVILRLEDIPETELLLDSAMKSGTWALNAETVSEIDAELLVSGISKEDADISLFALPAGDEYE